MDCRILKIENNMATIEITMPSEDLNEAIKQVYLRDRKHFNIQGFRKGKVPQKVIELNYGKEVFYDGAIDKLLPDAYKDALDELKLDPVSKPEIDVKQIEKGKELIVEATFAVKPVVEIKGYKGLEVEKPSVEVTETDIEADLKQQQNLNARLITIDDRPIQSGDTADIDYEGFVDGVAFEGGKAENYDLVIGSGSFIPGFEDQLIGKSVGDEVEVNVTFPDPYQSEELAGKDAVFKVKIHGIQVKELPELDDEFAMDTSEFDTLDELKEDIRKRLEKNAQKTAENQLRDKMIEAATELLDVEIPEPMIEMEIDGMVDEFSQQLRYQGMELEKYLEFTGKQMDELRDSLKEDALKRVKSTLTLESIVKQENITVTEEDLEEEYNRISEMYDKDVEELKKILAPQIDYINATIETKKAVDLLIEYAKFK